MPRYNIFDLDGTVIDSSHRHVSNPDGSFCLEGWKANCTPEKIMQDKLLPLANVWREVWNAGNIVVICTARVLSAVDFNFLRTHGLYFDKVLSREGETDKRPDYALKYDLLFSLNVDFTRVSNVFYEDNDAVRNTVKLLGINAIHPRDVK